MDSNRSYPEISFVDTDTSPLINSLIQSYEMFTGRTLYPADPTRLFILWIADIIMQERVIINESAKQNVPRYAKGEYLDSLAEIFKDAYRLEAEAAKTTFRFYLSMVLATQQLVPKGTRVTVDGEITFETIEDLYIKEGELSGDVSAKCQTLGIIGNEFVPGQITQIVDPYPYYEKVENVTTSAGGVEEEEDDAFYERMRESVESFSTAGPEGAYKYHAKTASPQVADVSVTSPERGVVDVRVLLKDGVLPGEEVINEVKNAISADKARPMTDSVTVSAPDIVNFELDFTYYIPAMSASSSTVIIQSVDNAKTEYLNWQTEKMGRDINPSYLISLLMKAGIKRVEVRKPVFTLVDSSKVAVLLNSPNVINGGVEDE